MARDFGVIEASFWQKPEVRRLSDDGRILAIYLRTCMYASGANAFFIPTGTVMHDMQWSDDRVESAFDALGLHPMVLRDRRTEVIYLLDWWREPRNKISNPKVAVYIARQLMALPDCALKARAIADLKETGWYVEIIAKEIGTWSLQDQQQALPFLGSPQIAPPAARKRAETPATRIDAEWQPTPEMLTYARERLAHDRIDREVTRFVRYFTGADAKKPAKKDWDATWRNWIDRAADNQPKPTNGTAVSHGVANGFSPHGEPWEMRIDRLFRDGFWLEDQWGSWETALATKAPAAVRDRYAGQRPPSKVRAFAVPPPPPIT